MEDFRAIRLSVVTEIYNHLSRIFDFNAQTDRHRAKVTVGAYMWAYELLVVVLA